MPGARRNDVPLGRVFRPRRARTSFIAVSVDAGFRNEAGDAPSELKSVPMKDVPMPVWMFVPRLNDHAKAQLDDWKHSNKAVGQRLSDADATGIFLAKSNGIDTLIDEQDLLAQTRYTVAADAASLNPKRAETVWKFLSAAVRPVALANGDLRAARSTEEWGAVRRTIVVDGITRHWLEFVPKTLRKTADDKPHTPLPMDNFLMYDTFLSKWSRGPDGTRYYMGKAVK